MEIIEMFCPEFDSIHKKVVVQKLLSVCFCFFSSIYSGAKTYLAEIEYEGISAIYIFILIFVPLYMRINSTWCLILQ